MSTRINEDVNGGVKQLRYDSKYIRWCRFVYFPPVIFMPIIAKGNKYQGIEAKE